MKQWMGRERRSANLLLAAAFLASLALSACLMAGFLGTAEQRVLDAQKAYVGRMLAGHGAEDLSFLSAPPDAAEIEAGEQALRAYGFHDGMPAGLLPAFEGMGMQAAAWAALMALAWLVPAALAVRLLFAGLTKRMERMALAADRAMEGDFSVHVPDAEDSGFDRLGHKFNQMRERLGQGMRRLEREQDMLRDTLADISHQLKTPLATALMYSELALDSPTLDETARRDFLHRSQTSMERMDRLIRTLLTMARIESGQVPFRNHPILLTDAVDAAIDATSALAASAGVSLAVERDPAQDSSEARVAGDVEWLSEALSNLIKNSIEHAGEDRRVLVRAQSTPLVCRIVVSDRGAGIPETEWPHLFERFHVRPAGRKSDAVGIGLSLAHRIIRRMDGDLTPGRTPGGGATFTILLPRFHESDKPVIQRSPD